MRGDSGQVENFPPRYRKKPHRPSSRHSPPVPRRLDTATAPLPHLMAEGRAITDPVTKRRSHAPYEKTPPRRAGFSTGAGRLGDQRLRAAPKRLLKRSTRPPVVACFCLPV